MNTRALAIMGVMALIVPGTAIAQEHKCACCAKSGAHDHTAAQPPVAPPAPTVEPHASIAAPAYQAAYEGLYAGVIYSVMRHSGMDVELTIGIGEKSFDVVVSPVKFLDAKRVVFRPGERVEVVGARWDRGAGDTIVAREIYTVDQTIVVRDAEGRPLWN